jgi:hypothetical protein
MKCFFCQREIEGRHENHHRLPRRFYKRGTDHRSGNLVPVHHDCHVRFNRELDNPHWKLREFKRAMEPINYGEGIFA